ncbi:MAG TPA: polyprenyl synthetase family protein [Flavobacterium sp.]|nr:polyprenyl synthetase family protein [Flavobacterium sp.]
MGPYKIEEEYGVALTSYLSEFKKNFPSSFVDLVQMELSKKSTDRLSLGKVYLFLSLDQNKPQSLPTKNQIAVRLDILFILCDYLDDILDGDSVIALPKNELLINAMSLLFISIGELCELTKNYLDTSKILFFLTESVNGERFDFYSTLSEDSSAEVQLVFYLACPDNELIWKDCAQNLSTAFQLQNDALDCMDTSKSDLVLFKETLPFTKALEYARINTDKRFLTIIEHRITDEDSLAFLAFYMEECGAVEYCLRAASLYFEEAFQILKNNSNISVEVFTLLKSYLKE